MDISCGSGDIASALGTGDIAEHASLRAAGASRVALDWHDRRGVHHDRPGPAGEHSNHIVADLAKVAFYVTLGGLVMAEVVQPEIAVLVGVGHMLASSRSRAAREAGEAVEETT